MVSAGTWVASYGKVWKIAVPALLIALLVTGGLYYRSHQQSKRLTEKDTIVLADFANTKPLLGKREIPGIWSAPI